MCTRSQGERMQELYSKYHTKRKVEMNDLSELDKLAGASRIVYSYEVDGIYAEAYRLC
jgi:hypothetical protein